MKLPPRTPVPTDVQPPKHGDATEPQLKYIAGLRAERAFNSPEHAARFDARLAELIEKGELSKQMASQVINYLRERPFKPKVKGERQPDAAPGSETRRRVTPDATDLPTGRYAIENAAGELRFYRVWRGTRNPNYIKLYLLHGPDETEVPYGPGALSIINQIATDAREAALRYGREIGCCSNCGKRLTNRLSRELSIGPVCGGRWYHGDWADVRAAARDAIIARGEDPDENVDEG
jgi:hypothetical protein